MNLVKWNPGRVYQHTQLVVGEVQKCQIEIRKAFTREQSMISRIGSRISMMMGRGKQYTLDELFLLQEMNLASLNSELACTIEESRSELKTLEEYLDRRTNELYLALEQVPDAKTATHPEKKLTKVERRKMMEDMQNYHLLNETIVDTAKELDFVDALEDVFRIIVHSSERTLKKSERLEQHISHTKLAYRAIVQQHKVVSSLGYAIETMEQFGNELFSLVDDAAQTILQVANKGFSYNALQLKSTLSVSSSLNTYQAREAERIAKKIRERG